MDFKSGDTVSVRLYSSVEAIKSIVESTEGENIVFLKLTREFANINLFEGDPVVLGFERNNEVFAAGCSIIEINNRQKYIKMNIENVSSLTNKRVNERFAVSVYADAKVKGSSKKENAIAKDISLKGIRICTKALFEIDDEIEINVFMDNIVILLNATVIWMVRGEFNNEYGLEITLMDLHNQTLIKQTLKNLKKEQEESVFKLREE